MEHLININLISSITIYRKQILYGYKWLNNNTSFDKWLHKIEYTPKHYYSRIGVFFTLEVALQDENATLITDDKLKDMNCYLENNVVYEKPNIGIKLACGSFKKMYFETNELLDLKILHLQSLNKNLLIID